MDETTEPAAPGEAERSVDKSAMAKLIVAGAVVALFVIFALQNTDSVEVEFLAWSFSTRQIVLMVMSAIAGIAMWELAGLLRRRSRAG